jgi:hypothetical protein
MMIFMNDKKFQSCPRTCGRPGEGLPGASRYNDELLKKINADIEAKLFAKMKVARIDNAPGARRPKDVYNNFLKYDGFEDLYWPSARRREVLGILREPACGHPGRPGRGREAVAMHGRTGGGDPLGVIALLAVMVAAIGSQVVARYVFNQALYWTEELGRHLMIWMVFLAAVLCLRKGYHLSITLLAQRLRPRSRALLQLAAAVVMGVFFLLMVVYG